jgi:hypothetical protein
VRLAQITLIRVPCPQRFWLGLGCNRVCSFLARIREAFPQFDEVGAGGVHKQQDADEFYVSLLSALSSELLEPAPPAVPALAPGSPANVVDTLLGLELEVELKCGYTFS